MMKLFPFLAALSLASGSNAQTTALDFTMNDCDGVSHHLFAELDSGYCVILDLVMMNCSPCVVASAGIAFNVIPATADPGRVRFYSIGYADAVNCFQMGHWKTDNGLPETVFAGMSAQTAYYGGFGMPTVIVLGGGSSHAVYYNELGYSSADDVTLIQAVNDGLAAANSLKELAVANVSVSPNPATEVLVVSGARWTNAEVLDLQGRSLINVQLNASKLDVSALPVGLYVLRLTDTTGKEGIARFEKR